MTDYEPYLADPAEPHRPGPLARWQPLLTTLSVLLVVVALGFLWLHSKGRQDPALTVPEVPSSPAATAPAAPAVPVPSAAP